VSYFPNKKRLLRALCQWQVRLLENRHEDQFRILELMGLASLDPRVWTRSCGVLSDPIPPRRNYIARCDQGPCEHFAMCRRHVTMLLGQSDCELPVTRSMPGFGAPLRLPPQPPVIGHLLLGRFRRRVAARLKRRLESTRPGLPCEGNAVRADSPVHTLFVNHVKEFVFDDLLRFQNSRNPHLPCCDTTPDRGPPTAALQVREPCVREVASAPLGISLHRRVIPVHIDLRFMRMETWAKRHSSNIRNMINHKAFVVLTFQFFTADHERSHPALLFVDAERRIQIFYDPSGATLMHPVGGVLSFFQRNPLIVDMDSPAPDPWTIDRRAGRPTRRGRGGGQVHGDQFLIKPARTTATHAVAAVHAGVCARHPDTVRWTLHRRRDAGAQLLHALWLR
jgi:hypothetical protein